MGWGAEQFAYATAGAFFLVCVAATLHPDVEMSLSARVAMSSAAGLLVALSLVTPPANSLVIGLLAWALPVAPAALLVMILRGVRRDDEPLQAPRVGPQGDDLADDAAGGAAARLAMAADPHTPPWELEGLAYGYEEVRVALSANPATPASVLSWLAATGDIEVLHVIAQRNALAEHGDDH